MTDALREGFELGGYRIQATIGSQATGTVYLATHVGTDESVALHVIADRLAKVAVFRERFHRELEALSELSNPYLLKVFETGEEVGIDEYDPVRLWAAVAPSPGPDLATVSLHQDKLTPAQAAHLVAQAAEALEEAHAVGVLHRGLEPGSILVDETDRSAHLGGFGLVDDGAVEGGTGDIHRSAYPPSPDYVAPEQIAGAPRRPPGRRLQPRWHPLFRPDRAAPVSGIEHRGHPEGPPAREGAGAERRGEHCSRDTRRRRGPCLGQGSWGPVRLRDGDGRRPPAQCGCQAS